MDKTVAFITYVALKRAYYAGEPICSDYQYDTFEKRCRETFPGDPDFDMPGYGEAHDVRMRELIALYKS